LPRAPFPICGIRLGVYYDLFTGEGVWEAFAADPEAHTRPTEPPPDAPDPASWCGRCARVRADCVCPPSGGDR